MNEATERRAVRPSRNGGSLLVAILLFSFSVGLVIYVAYPSVETISSTTQTHFSTATLYSTNSYLAYSPTTETLASTSCYLNDCYDYGSWGETPVPYTITDNFVWTTSPVSFEVTNVLYATSYSTNTLPPYVYVGSSENQLPTAVTILVLLIIAALSFLLVNLRRTRAMEIKESYPSKVTPAIPVQQMSSHEAERTEESAAVISAIGTKFCRECGAKIPRDSVFCEECGANLKLDPSKPSPELKPLGADRESTDAVENMQVLEGYCKRCGQPMNLLDEDERRWYCYKDDLLYYAKEHRWSDGVIANSRPMRPDSEFVKSSGAKFSGIASALAIIGVVLIGGLYLEVPALIIALYALHRGEGKAAYGALMLCIACIIITLVMAIGLVILQHVLRQ